MASDVAKNNIASIIGWSQVRVLPSRRQKRAAVPAPHEAAVRCGGGPRNTASRSALWVFHHGAIDMRAANTRLRRSRDAHGAPQRSCAVLTEQSTRRVRRRGLPARGRRSVAGHLERWLEHPTETTAGFARLAEAKG